MNTTRFLASLAAFTLSMIAPGAASAQTTTTESTLYACYVPKSGTVYRIKVTGTPVKCAPNHVEFSWTAGAQSAPQVIVSETKLFVIPPGYTVGVDAECPAGTVMLSGGWDATEGIVLKAGYPVGAIWRFKFTNTNGDESGVYLNATCLKLQ